MFIDSAAHIINYVTFNITTDLGAESFTFDNKQILGLIEFNTGLSTEIFNSELGESISFGRKRPRSFTFELNYYENLQARQDYQRILELVQRNYVCSFTLHTFISAFTALPSSIRNDTQFSSNTVSFNECVVELPDQAIDNTHRGKGAAKGAVKIRIIEANKIVFPVAACSLVTMSDFDTNPFYLDVNRDFLGVDLLRLDAGLIAEILSYPSGLLYNPVGLPITQLSYDHSQDRYVPDNGPNILSGDARVEIKGVQVRLKTGERCSITFDQTYHVAVVSTGDFDSRDFDDLDFDTETN